MNKHKRVFMAGDVALACAAGGASLGALAGTCGAWVGALVGGVTGASIALRRYREGA